MLRVVDLLSTDVQLARCYEYVCMVLDLLCKVSDNLEKTVD